MAITTRDRVKTYMGLTDGTYNTLIDFLIPKVEEDYLHIRNNPFDEDSDGIIYPSGAELTAILMISFLMSETVRRNGGTMNSETIGSYSYTRDNLMQYSDGYPKNIVGKIKRYVSSR